MSWVYIVREPTNGHVKIGHSVDVPARLRELQCCHPEELAIVRVLPGDRRLEKWLHDRFAPLRLKGEWFRFDELMATIEGPDFSVDPECHRDLIHALGGGAAVGSAIEVDAGTVRAWVLRNRIPPEYWPDIIRFSEERGVAVTADWLMKSTPARKRDEASDASTSAEAA